MSGVLSLYILFSLTQIVCMCVCVCVCVCVYVLEQLVAVNDEHVRNKTVEEITRLCKGTPNSLVKLTLLPPNQ
jgi:hypothetical protein